MIFGGQVPHHARQKGRKFDLKKGPRQPKIKNLYSIRKNINFECGLETHRTVPSTDSSTSLLPSEKRPAAMSNMEALELVICFEPIWPQRDRSMLIGWTIPFGAALFQPYRKNMHAFGIQLGLRSDPVGEM